MPARHVRRAWLRLPDGSGGPEIEEGQGPCGRRALIMAAARQGEPGMTAGAEGRDPGRAWRRLMENPDYFADWRAHAGPTVREAAPHVFRTQTEADLKAARWNLLAWEDPRHPQWAGLFWADAPMVEARVAEPGPSGRHSWPRLLRRARVRYSGLRLLDGTLVLKVSRGRETGQIGVIDGAAFDPALSGLEVRMRWGGHARGNWVRLRSLEPVVLRESGVPPSRPRGA